MKEDNKNCSCQPNEDDPNFVHLCPECAMEHYHFVKNTYGDNNSIYCRFLEEIDDLEVQESMWVIITSGDRNCGQGTVDNIPEWVNFKYGEKISFHTDEHDVTYAKKITN